MFLDKLFFKRGKKEGVEKELLDKYLSALSDYIHRALSNGLSERETRKALVSAGWPKRIVDNEIFKIKFFNDQKKQKIKTRLRLPTCKKEIKNKKIGKNDNSKLKYKKRRARGDKMPRRMKKEEAEHILRNVPPENCFWVNNGPIIGSLEALRDSLSQIGDETFSYHVNNEKNDFSTWISEVVGDKTLARSIARVKTKQTLVKRVADRIDYLKSIVESK